MLMAALLNPKYPAMMEELGVSSATVNKGWEGIKEEFLCLALHSKQRNDAEVTLSKGEQLVASGSVLLL
jgi:hypothetical protein